MENREIVNPLPSSIPAVLRKWVPELCLAVFVLSSVFIELGSRGLVEPDEGRYAEIAREILATGDWLVPTLNGFAHLQKPPMTYWLTAASFKMFGLGEWAARF